MISKIVKLSKSIVAGKNYGTGIEANINPFKVIKKFEKLKSLIIIRHAKSSWDNYLQKDFDRPLNDRGHKDAPIMAKRLMDKKVTIDAFISSPAKRAFTTCKYFIKAYNRKEKDIIQKPELYEASVADFYEVIYGVDETFDNIAVFSHNPGITAFVNELTKTAIDNMPTCGIFAVKIDIVQWKEFPKAEKEFWFFDYPKLRE